MSNVRSEMCFVRPDLMSLKADTGTKRNGVSGVIAKKNPIHNETLMSHVRECSSLYFPNDARLRKK